MRRLLVIAFAVLSFQPLTLLAQWNGQLDPSKCYSDLLQKTEVYSHSERLKLALLSIIDETNFSQVSGNSSVTSLFPELPFTAGFSAFSEARRHYFEQHRLDVDYESATASSSIGLDPQASHIFDSCIYGMALAGNYGLSAYGASEDETTATVQLFWKPTEAGKPVVIDDSTVDNANVVGETAGKLFPKKYSIRDAKTRTLKRIDPDKPITITLDTDVRATPIRIPPVPPRSDCQMKAFESDPNTGVAFVWHDAPLADLYLKPYNGRNGQEFIITHPVDGIVTYVHCDKHGADFIELDDPSGEGQGIGTNVAACAGSKNGAQRTIIMDVRWQKSFMVCTKIPWKNHSDEKNWAAPKPSFTELQ